MLDWLIRVHSICRTMQVKATEAYAILVEDDPDLETVDTIKAAMREQSQQLVDVLPQDFPKSRLPDLQRHIRFSERNDYHDILRSDLPDIEATAESYARKLAAKPAADSFEGLLHPIIRTSALAHFKAQEYRLSILEAMVAISDQIRDRTDLDMDGSELANTVFSEKGPHLLVTDNLKTENGRNEQVGFMELCRGAYRRLRNPKAHTRRHKIDRVQAAQCLVFTSLLAQTIELAKTAKKS